MQEGFIHFMSPLNSAKRVRRDSSLNLAQTSRYAMRRMMPLLSVGPRSSVVRKSLQCYWKPAQIQANATNMDSRRLPVRSEEQRERGKRFPMYLLKVGKKPPTDSFAWPD